MVEEKNKNIPLSIDTVDSVTALIEHIWDCLENVCDPEVPVLSVLDLGVVRAVIVHYGAKETSSRVVPATNKREILTAAAKEPFLRPADKSQSYYITIQITPTYTGCPAMSMIAANIKLELLVSGYEQVSVEEILSPAWTTDWMSEAGKKKLLAYGIAPPQSKARMEKMLFDDVVVPCPQCGSENTERISEFGSTACKSLHRCLDCREPFDYFKCH